MEKQECYPKALQAVVGKEQSLTKNSKEAEGSGAHGKVGSDEELVSDDDRRPDHIYINVSHAFRMLYGGIKLKEFKARYSRAELHKTPEWIAATNAYYNGLDPWWYLTVRRRNELKWYREEGWL